MKKKRIVFVLILSIFFSCLFGNNNCINVVYSEGSDSIPISRIKWRILSIEGDKALVVSDKGIIYKTYNENCEKVTWETCDARKWLNENFINEAFSEEEQDIICITELENKDNESYLTNGGNNTNDKIFLLSKEDVTNSEYGFGSDASCIVSVTDYVIAQMKKGILSSPDTYSDKGIWWLRSVGSEGARVVVVRQDGSLYGYGNYVQIGKTAISNGADTSSATVYASVLRPAMWISLNSDIIIDAGEIDSEGVITKNDDGYNNPRINDNSVTTWDCIYLGSYILDKEFDDDAYIEPKSTATPTEKPTASPTESPQSTYTPTASPTPIDVIKPVIVPTPTITPNSTNKPSENPEKDNSNKELQVGDIVKDSSNKAIYKIINDNNDGIGRVSLVSPVSKKCKAFIIPDIISLSGKDYIVTKIEDKAFKNCNKLERITIGKNVNYIGKNAFNKCGKLKNIKIKTLLLTKKTIGKNAFKGIYKKAVIKCPKKKKTSYKNLLKKSGAPKKIKVK